MDDNDFETEQVFATLKGKVLSEVAGAHAQSEEITFRCADGATFRMWHEQDCCEGVSVVEVIGDTNDLIGTPILQAEESTNTDNPPEHADSFLWTFYRLQTIRGSVVIRWLGESNGYYSESVSFAQTAPASPIGPFPAEPAPGSPEAVAAAAETIRSLSPEPERPARGEHEDKSELVEKIRRAFAINYPPPDLLSLCATNGQRLGACTAWDYLSAGTRHLLTKVKILELENALLHTTLKAETSLKEEARRQRDLLADAARRLAMLGLQSERYASDPDYRDAVDEALRAAGGL